MESHCWPIYFIVSTLKNLSFILSSIHTTQIFFFYFIVSITHYLDFFSFILLFPQMKVLWYFALFSKGKVSQLFTWCSHIIWQFLTFVAPSTYWSVVHGSEVLYMGEQNAHWWVNNASRSMWAWWIGCFHYPRTHTYGFKNQNRQIIEIWFCFLFNSWTIDSRQTYAPFGIVV